MSIELSAARSTFNQAIALSRRTSIVKDLVHRWCATPWNDQNPKESMPKRHLMFWQWKQTEHSASPALLRSSMPYKMLATRKRQNSSIEPYLPLLVLLHRYVTVGMCFVRNLADLAEVFVSVYYMVLTYSSIDLTENIVSANVKEISIVHQLIG